jgi:long-chain acyl-CoA synthetase
VLVRDADPGAFWRRVGDERATVALVPGGLLDALPPAQRPTGLAGFLCPAGAPLEALRRTEQRSGVPVCVGHGLVEATCASTLVPAGAGPEVHAWLRGTAAPTVGTATAGAEVAILDPDGGRRAEGERGEVCVRGDVVTPDAGPWLRTGDEGFTDTGPDGRPYVFLTGRVRPQAVSSGGQTP